MGKNDLAKDAARLMKEHGVGAIYATSDGNFFFNKAKAIQHGLKTDGLYFEFGNEPKTKEEPGEIITPTTGNGFHMTYEEMKKEVKRLGLKLPDNKKATLIEALKKKD